MALKNAKDVLVVTKENGKDEIKLEYSKLKKALLNLRAVNHPLRKQMLTLLEEQKKLTVTEIYIKLRIEQSVASQHLAILRKAEIVETSRNGKFIFYSVNKNRINEVSVLINDLA
jgi:DNA-binding transcriptional ArsR family regulator